MAIIKIKHKYPRYAISTNLIKALAKNKSQEQEKDNKISSPPRLDNSISNSPADKQILNEHDKTCLCPKNKRQNEKILWTAEEIQNIRNITNRIIRDKQFLDADEVKRIIEKLQPCYKGNTKYQLLEYLLKRLGLK